MKNKFGPCIEKKCSVCCDPVKVRSDFPVERIPANEKGDKIWIDREEVFVPEEHIDTVRLRTFDCRNFDKEQGKCLDYEKRPEICRNTSCVVDGKDDLSMNNIEDLRTKNSFQ